MAEDRKQQPMLLALLAAVGLISLPQAMRLQRAAPAIGQESPWERPSQAVAEDELGDGNHKDSDVLKPLLDFLSGGAADPGTENVKGMIDKYLAAGGPDTREAAIRASPPGLASRPDRRCGKSSVR